MSRKKDDKNLNRVLVDAIDELLEEVMSDAQDKDGKPLYSLTDRCKIIDRALALEKIKLKINDEEWGAGFLPTEEPETEEDVG